MNTLAVTERVVRIIKSKEVMKIKVDCKFITGKFSEGVCLAHSKGKDTEKCKGECEDCKKKNDDNI